MKIAIASGKGGTGKTTVAVNLALTLQRVQVLDCDVEDPDSGIFLRPETSSIAPVSVHVPQVLPHRCTYCRACAEFCRYNALVVLPEHWMVTKELCKDCGGCYRVCPEQALMQESRSVGTLERGTVGEIEIVTGRLNPGEVMATPVIRRVKKEARTDLPVLVDSPPGSACPMMHAVEDADYCLMVTEPTPFGLHDLEQAVAVVRQMDIPIGVVINRSDLGRAELKDFCRQAGVPILLEIPYDNALARAYAQGRAIVDVDAQWQGIFNQLWDGIMDQLGPREMVS